MIRPRILIFVVILTMLLSAEGFCQQVFIDQGVQVNGLWCFPLAADPLKYVYIPASSRLAEDDKGRPQFSFVRYVINTAGDDKEKNTITTAGGGGILHFLVLYETPEKLVETAQQNLRRMLKNDSVVLRGPIMFQEGRYALVSSIINPTGGSSAPKVLATGRAPVLEGNRLALSFELPPKEATLLMQSFAMNTPDVSIVFDMAFEGLSEAYDAQLVIDWTEVLKSESFSAGGSIYFVSADVEKMVHDLIRNNTVKLRSRGSNSSMEALLSTVYSKLIELLFRPVKPERVPPEARGGLMDALSALFNPRSGPLSSRNTTGFGAYVGYRLKDIKSSGVSVLDFNHRATVGRHSFIAFNLGDFYHRFGKDPNYFRAVNVDDPMFQQREIQVSVDGALVADFERTINNVSITLRKVHQNGHETLREVILDRDNLTKPVEDLRYGYNDDRDRMVWMKYTYRTRWSFKGGGVYQTGWTTTDAGMINLFAPYERRTVQLVGDAEALQKKRVRACIVQIEYMFFDERRRHQLVVRPDKPLGEQKVEVTLPQNQFDYSYTITWQFEGNQSSTYRGSDSSGLVFIDEIRG